ncbi:MAG: TIGR03016 family PEP-CTERM system-associated outer membrane protein [Gammaproteobacteria bacterium]|nr:TIGR03016 family PEP-CTERM system-associated outer membrane protein [Gammaproteobacteria bacterium]
MKLLSVNSIEKISIGFVLFFFVNTLSIAKDIEMAPSIRVGAGYSDNIELEHDNERSSFYTNITPGIIFKKDGARVKTLLDYSASGTMYTSESDLNDVQHRLFANAESELLKHSVFLDMNATISQQTLDNNLSSSPDGISGSSNLTQTYTYAFSPYWKKKWQSYAESTLRYNYDEVKYSGSDRSGDDNKSNSIALNVESGKAFTRYFWDFDYEYQDISYDRSGDTNSETYKVRLGYHYSRKLDLTMTTGYEDYDDRNGNRNDGGTGWRIGAIWTPTQRTNLELEVGHRFFGNTYLLDFTHRSRRLSWHFRYDDSITDSRNEIINNNNSQQTNPNGTIVPLSNVTDQYYLNRRYVGDVSYSYKKSTITLGVFDERRYYQDSDEKDEEDIGADLSWNFNIGRRTNMITQYSWHQLEDARLNNTQDRNIVSWSLNRRLTPTMSGVLKLSYSDNDADIKRDEYTENAISLYINKNF